MPETRYIYLDTDADRLQLVNEIAQVRRDVLSMIESLPPNLYYEPRYHDWSPAAMLAHLHFMDKISLILVQLGLLGIRVPIPEAMLNWFNNTTAGIFRRRLIASTIKDIQNNEATLQKFIMQLPMKKFTNEVYHPLPKTYLTVERVVQAFFLHHWQGHLQTMREVEGINQ